MLKNIAKKTLYGWALWEHIEATRRNINTNQMERWHLRSMHLGTKVSYLARWLTSHIALHTSTGKVTVRSTWIDQYPQAHSEYLTSAGSQEKVSVELADLLLIVKTQNGAGTPLTERAVLIQAKCSDSPTRLDSTTANSSTDKERHLLEACCTQVRVTSGRGASSSPINDARPAYDLGASPTQPGLENYARYTLIPRTKFPKQLPYITIWPQSLSTDSGSPTHLSDVLLAMAGIGTPGAFAGASVNTSAAITDWDYLVSDLTTYCDSQNPLNRFKNKTSTTFHRTTEKSYEVGDISSFKSILKSILRRLFEGSWIERSFQLNIMANETMPPFPPETGHKPGDEPERGFTLLQITITTSESFN